MHPSGSTRTGAGGPSIAHARLDQVAQRGGRCELAVAHIAEASDAL